MGWGAPGDAVEGRLGGANCGYARRGLRRTVTGASFFVAGGPQRDVWVIREGKRGDGRLEERIARVGYGFLPSQEQEMGGG